MRKKYAILRLSDMKSIGIDTLDETKDAVRTLVAHKVAFEVYHLDPVSNIYARMELKTD